MWSYSLLITAFTALFATGAFTRPSHTTRACQNITTPFYLTVVPSNGSATYPVYTATVSRGVEVLSSAQSYTDQYTYNYTDNRIYIANSTLGTAAQRVGYSVIFGSQWSSFGVPYGDNGLLSITTDDECNNYLEVTGSSSIYGWYALPNTNDLPVTITWEGSGSSANAALRIDA